MSNERTSWTTLVVSAAITLLVMSLCIAGIVWAWRFILG